MSHGTFATTINCMDGRTQLPVIEFLKKEYGVDYVDSVTEPGPIKYLADNADAAVVEQIKKRVMISTEKHGSSVIAIVAHEHCAGNPIEKDEQIKQLAASVSLVRGWAPGAEVFGVWVEGTNWTVARA
jgi:hypothetical protein